MLYMNIVGRLQPDLVLPNLRINPEQKILIISLLKRLLHTIIVQILLTDLTRMEIPFYSLAARMKLTKAFVFLCDFLVKKRFELFP